MCILSWTNLHWNLYFGIHFYTEGCPLSLICTSDIFILALNLKVADCLIFHHFSKINRALWMKSRPAINKARFLLLIWLDLSHPVRACNTSKTWQIFSTKASVAAWHAKNRSLFGAPWKHIFLQPFLEECIPKINSQDKHFFFFY